MCHRWSRHLGSLQVAAGEHSEAAVGGVGVVEVDEDGHHGVVLVGEVVVVLVGGEGRPLPRGLEVRLGVVQHHAPRPHQLPAARPQPGVQQQPGEGGAVQLQVVYGQHAAAAAAAGAGLPPPVPRPHGLQPPRLPPLPLEQGVVLRTQLRQLGRPQQPGQQQVALPPVGLHLGTGRW